MNWSERYPEVKRLRDPLVAEEAEEVPPPAASLPTGSSNERMLQSRWVVLGLLFGVTGAIGLPLLWYNRRFSPMERVFWSVAVLSYTFALLGLTYAIFMWVWGQLSAFQAG